MKRCEWVIKDVLAFPLPVSAQVQTKSIIGIRAEYPQHI